MYGGGGHVSHVTTTAPIIFFFPLTPKAFHTKFLSNPLSDFLGQKIFETAEIVSDIGLLFYEIIMYSFS